MSCGVPIPCKMCCPKAQDLEEIRLGDLQTISRHLMFLILVSVLLDS